MGYLRFVRGRLAPAAIVLLGSVEAVCLTACSRSDSGSGRAVSIVRLNRPRRARSG